MKDTRSWWRKKRWWVVGSILFAIWVGITNQRIPIFMGDPIIRTQPAPPELIFPIGDARLSIRRNSRFLLSEHEKYLRQFPSVLSCLTDKAQETEFINVGAIDWMKFSNQWAVETCLENTFQLLQDKSRIVLWLRYNEIQKIKIIETNFNGSKILISAFFNSNLNGSIISRNIIKKYISKLSSGEIFTINFDENNKYMFSGFSIQSK